VGSNLDRDRRRLQVTIFGESAGGTSVAVLLSSPAAQGLYARAIVQSNPYALAIKTTCVPLPPVWCEALMGVRARGTATTRSTWPACLRRRWAATSRTPRACGPRHDGCAWTAARR
jgi:hypothetical protein